MKACLICLLYSCAAQAHFELLVTSRALEMSNSKAEGSFVCLCLNSKQASPCQHPVYQVNAS